MKPLTFLVSIVLLVTLCPAVFPAQAAPAAPSHAAMKHHSLAVVLARHRPAHHSLAVAVMRGNRIGSESTGPGRLAGGNGGCSGEGTISEYKWGWRFHVNSCLVDVVEFRPLAVSTIAVIIARECRQCDPFAWAIAHVLATHRDVAQWADTLCGHQGIYVDGAWVGATVWITAVCQRYRG